MRLTADPLAALHGHLFVWVPVCLGIGIGLYFGLPIEPDMPVYLGLGVVWGATALAWLLGPFGWRPFAALVCLLALGVLLAGARAHLVAAPVLSFRYYGPVEGRILLIDRSSSDQIRLTLDRVVLERVPPDETPDRVRITIGAKPPPIVLEPGKVVMLTGFLSPPEGPSEPGGFDFQRMAWFLRLGAVGFSRSPVMALAQPDPGALDLWFSQLRQRISDAVRAELPGDAGGFITAVLTNDTSGISRERLDSLRASNLAHILSISGLHMALLTGFVFATLRSAIALVPPLALRVSSKKLAAAVGLASAAFYLGLSGGAVATERSFIMVAVIMLAVLVDRRAISLRSIAIAAVLVLVSEPESLVEPGFQMSFAATIALVASFNALRDLPPGRWHPPRWLGRVLGVLLCSVVAGLATAPFGAATFNKLSGYGVLANMLAEPVMALVIMPGAVIAAVLSPLGLAAPMLWLMELGARWILMVSDFVAGLDGAVVPVPQPSAAVLPLLSLGGLWVVLMIGRLRWIGLVPMLLALGLWATVQRPTLLITQNAALIGLMTPEGRVVSPAKGESFAAKSWLENDGDQADPKLAAARTGFQTVPDGLRFPLGALRGQYLTGEVSAARLATDCQIGVVLIIAEPLLDPAPATLPCQMIDRLYLLKSGAVAVFAKDRELRLVAARLVAGQRLWSGPPARLPQKKPATKAADIASADAPTADPG